MCSSFSLFFCLFFTVRKKNKKDGISLQDDYKMITDDEADLRDYVASSHLFVSLLDPFYSEHMTKVNEISFNTF